MRVDTLGSLAPASDDVDFPPTTDGSDPTPDISKYTPGDSHQNYQIGNEVLYRLAEKYSFVYDLIERQLDNFVPVAEIFGIDYNIEWAAHDMRTALFNMTEKQFEYLQSLYDRGFKTTAVYRPVRKKITDLEVTAAMNFLNPGDNRLNPLINPYVEDYLGEYYRKAKEVASLHSHSEESGQADTVDTDNVTQQQMGLVFVVMDGYAFTPDGNEILAEQELAIDYIEEVVPLRMDIKATALDFPTALSYAMSLRRMGDNNGKEMVIERNIVVLGEDKASEGSHSWEKGWRPGLCYSGSQCWLLPFGDNELPNNRQVADYVYYAIEPGLS